MVDFSSNLLEEHQRSSWGDLPPMEQRAAASSLLEGLERNAMLLVKSHSANMNYSRLQSNISEHPSPTLVDSFFTSTAAVEKTCRALFPLSLVNSSIYSEALSSASWYIIIIKW